MKKKKVALVLGGGAALGFAHIGVIKTLEKYNIPIDIVVGTSMGGLVGAGYCAGLSLEDMSEFASKFRKINFVDVNFNLSGIFSGKGIMNNINKFLPDINIEDLNKTFACVSCDLKSGEEIIFDCGSIRKAVRATISIPGVFVPMRDGDKMLVDGGIVNNLPVDVAKAMGADVIIACDVLKEYKIKDKPKSFFTVLIHAMNRSVEEIQNYKAKDYDILITPNLSEIDQIGFTKKQTLYAIQKGEEETEKYIKKIQGLIKD